MSEGAAFTSPARPIRRSPRLRALLVVGILSVSIVASVVGAFVLLSPRVPCFRTFSDPTIPMNFAVVIDHWNASIKMTTASVCDPPSAFRFFLSLGSSRAGPQPLLPSGLAATIRVNGTPFLVTWVDGSKDGLVDAGDSFLVSGDGAPLPAPSDPESDLRYTLEFQSPDGEWLGAARWGMPILPTAPTVVLGAPIVSDGNATIPILNVSAAWAPWRYWLNLAVGSTAGIPTTMPQVSGPPGSRVFIGGVQYNLPWVDADGSGTVSAGDRFLVNGNESALPVSTKFIFILLWMDVNLVSAVTWTT